MPNLNVLTRIAIGIALLATAAAAAPEAGTRTEQIEEARDAKAATLEADDPGKLEQRLIWFKDDRILDRLTAGAGAFRLKIGGMPASSGFAAGPQYLRDDLAGGRLSYDALATISVRGWTKLETGLSAPGLQGNRWVLDVRAARYDYKSLPFYGPGPGSLKEGRSNYRLEDTTLDVLAGRRLRKTVMAGGSAGYLNARVRDGEDARYISTAAVYPEQVQAFGSQMGFVRTGVFLQGDSRDNPGGPRRGRLYVARFDDYRARSSQPYNFQRLDLEMQQYVPLYNQRRVIMIRARTIQSFTQGSNQVPFFQQAVLGGSDDLRGFRPYRFQDNNMFVMNLEYRWEVFSGLDMAVFGDAGRVSPRRWDFGLGQIETSAGFGLRFNARNSTFLRLDVGFSHEGFQVFVKFHDLFRERRLAASSAPQIF